MNPVDAVAPVDYELAATQPIDIRELLDADAL